MAGSSTKRPRASGRTASTGGPMRRSCCAIAADWSGHDRCGRRNRTNAGVKSGSDGGSDPRKTPHRDTAVDLAACLLGGVECDRDCLVGRELPSLREGLLERRLVELSAKLGQRLAVVLHDPRKPATE